MSISCPCLHVYIMSLHFLSPRNGLVGTVRFLGATYFAPGLNWIELMPDANPDVVSKFKRKIYIYIMYIYTYDIHIIIPFAHCFRRIKSLATLQVFASKTHCKEMIWDNQDFQIRNLKTICITNLLAFRSNVLQCFQGPGLDWSWMKRMERMTVTFEAIGTSPVHQTMVSWQYKAASTCRTSVDCLICVAIEANWSKRTMTTIFSSRIPFYFSTTSLRLTQKYPRWDWKVVQTFSDFWFDEISWSHLVLCLGPAFEIVQISLISLAANLGFSGLFVRPEVLSLEVRSLAFL